MVIKVKGVFDEGEDGSVTNFCDTYFTGSVVTIPDEGESTHEYVIEAPIEEAFDLALAIKSNARFEFTHSIREAIEAAKQCN